MPTTEKPTLPSDLSTLTWHTSSYSNGAGGMCVQVASVDGGVAIRDSKNPDVALAFTREEYRAFTDGVRDGELLF